MCEFVCPLVQALPSNVSNVVVNAPLRHRSRGVLSVSQLCKDRNLLALVLGGLCWSMGILGFLSRPFRKDRGETDRSSAAAAAVSSPPEEMLQQAPPAAASSLDIGSSVKPGSDVLVGDCRHDEGAGASPCGWTIQKARDGQREYRIVF